MFRLDTISIAGYKSIREMRLDLGRVTVLIGANGAGKSNLVSFFRVLSFAMQEELQLFVGQEGGADSLLHYGARTSPVMEFELGFSTEAGANRYRARWAHAAGDTLVYADEALGSRRDGQVDEGHMRSLGAGHKETELVRAAADGDRTAGVARAAATQWQAYQFHDTSSTSSVRQHRYADDCRFLRSDAGNLVSFLAMLRRKHERHYLAIRDSLRLVAPFFGDFEMDPSGQNGDSLRLNWREAGRPDVLFGPHHLSDGTLRAAALLTVLQQPDGFMPDLLVIDEPELGLHPYAIELVASLIRSVSARRQVIVSTQSAPLVNCFDPEDIVVVDRIDGASTFERQSSGRLREWLEEYSVGELWEKNVIGGRPA